MTPKYYDLVDTPSDTGMQSLVEDIAEHGVDELEVYGGKWRELYFFKDGKSKMETDEWDTEEAAQKQIDYIMNPSEPSFVAFNDGVRIPCRNLSHAIPMPVGDA